MANPAIVEVESMSIEQLRAENARITAELAKHSLNAANNKRTKFSVTLSEVVEVYKDGKAVKNPDGTIQTKPGKGGFKVLGLGSQFPVTLYPEQFEILWAHKEEIQACYNDPSNRAKSNALRAK